MEEKRVQIASKDGWKVKKSKEVTSIEISQSFLRQYLGLSTTIPISIKLELFLATIVESLP